MYDLSLRWADGLLEMGLLIRIWIAGGIDFYIIAISGNLTLSGPGFLRKEFIYAVFMANQLSFQDEPIQRRMRLAQRVRMDWLTSLFFHCDHIYFLSSGWDRARVLPLIDFLELKLRLVMLLQPLDPFVGVWVCAI